MKLRDRLGISVQWQERLSYLMEVSLIGMFFVGLYEQNLGIIVNTGVGLLVTQLPPILERDYQIPMDPALTLWITSAVFLHGIGVIGLPGTEALYRLDGWDHITHTLSASVVAAVGYATARSFDIYDDSVDLPPKFMFVFILLFVLAFGVFWEVIEFLLGEIARLAGGDPILAQHGLEDTMLDLIFNTIGAVVVATWGTAHLTDVVGAVAAHFENDPTTGSD